MLEKMVGILIKSDYNDKGTKEANKDIKTLDQNSKNTTKSMSLLGKSVTFGVLAKGAYEATQKMVELSKKSADYLETLNVLDVAFNGNTDSIKQFTSAISETLNLDDATLIKSASSFKTLANSMQYTNEVGTEFSKMLTQMTLDLSSLYNMDFQKAQSALQYAIQGQGKTLKAMTGASVLETTIQTTLDALGVDAYVESMTDAEKAMARVITISYQLQNSQGDLARTIESPANQFRVLGEQIAQAGRNIGNIFLPMIGAILPYVNAVLIVINKLLSAIANLFGFDATKWDFFESGSNSFDDLSTSIGGVGDSASKAKKQLQGLREFDKLNVLRTPTSSGGAGGAGGGGGMNPNLLNAFNDIWAKYNTSLNDIETKATRISKILMEWLNVLNPIKEPLEKIASLTYDGLVYAWENVLKPLGTWAGTTLLPAVVEVIASALNLVYQVMLKLKPILTTTYEKFVQPFGKVIGKTIVNTLEDISKFINIISKSKIATNVLAWVIAFKSFQNIGLKVLALLSKTQLGGTILSITDLLKGGKNTIDDYKSAWNLFVETITPKIDKTTTSMGKMEKATVKLKNGISVVKTATAGLITAFAGFEILKSSLEDVAQNGINLGNVLTTLIGAFTTVAGVLVTVNAITAIWNVTLLTNPVVLIASAVIALVGAIGLLISAQNESTEATKSNTSATDENIKKLKELKEQSEENALSDLAQADRAIKLKDELLNLVDANGKVSDANKTRAQQIITILNKALGMEIELQGDVIKLDGQEITSKENLKVATENYITAMKTEAILEAYREEYIEALKQQKEARDKLNKEYQTTQIELAKIDEAERNGKITADEAYSQRTMQLGLLRENQKKLQEQYETSSSEVKNYEDLLTASNSKNMEEMNMALGKYVETSTNSFEGANKKASELSSTYSKKMEDAYSTSKTNIETTMSKLPTTGEYTLNVKGNTYGLKTSIESFFKRNSYAFGAVGVTVPPLQFANGGLPPVGQMFIANERGPELVGQIGGQSFVANQNQMMDIIDKKLSNAGGLQNATFVIQVGSEEVARTVLKDLNSMAKSNGKPITIGG